MFLNKMKYLERGTGTTQYLVERYGYDTKQAMHAYRILSTLQWFMDRGSFEKAIRYDDNAAGKERRELLLEIRNGKFTIGEMKEMLEKHLKVTEEKYRERYLKTESDREMTEKIRTGVKEFILNETKKEMCRAQKEEDKETE